MRPARDPPPTTTDRISTSLATKALASRRFKPLMTEGHYRAIGRRGSRTAPLSEIPASAWPHLGIDVIASQIIEREPDGAIWYDVRVLAPLPGDVPEFGSSKHCRDWAFAHMPPKRNETPKAYLDCIAKFCERKGFPQNSLRQRWSDYRKGLREQKQRKRERS
jgi:hypothetical protein